MWSGKCFNEHGGRGYIYLDFGNRDGKDYQRWLPAVQVKICSSRAAKPVSWFSQLFSANKRALVKENDLSFSMIVTTTSKVLLKKR